MHGRAYKFLFSVDHQVYRENLQASIFSHANQAQSRVGQQSVSPDLLARSYKEFITQRQLLSFSLFFLFTPFLKPPPHPASISYFLSLAIHIRKTVFPFSRDPKHFLSLYEGLSGTFSTKQTAKVGIQQKVGRQYVLTFLGAFQRLQRFYSLALVAFSSMMAAITTCRLLPSTQTSQGTL